VTLALIAAQVPRLSARADLPTEIEKSNTAIQHAEAAYAQAWRDVEAGRRTPDAAADDLGREVLPRIRDARTRAASILADLQGKVSASTGPNGRGGPDWRQLQDAYAWSTYLAAHEDAWQLRVRGLRTRDRSTIAEAARHERAAVDAFERIVAGSRPSSPH
jgi:hypothetical protein